MTDLPLPELTDVQHELLRLSFHHLLDAGTAVSPRHLSQVGSLTREAVVGVLAVLSQVGRVTLDEDNGVTGALGLTIVPTTHRLALSGTTRYTWCALDALGIMGALSATGTISSSSPWSGSPIEITIESGRPRPDDPDRVLFLARYEACSPVVDNWCPMVNFFENEAAAIAWAKQKSVSGECLRLDAASVKATTLWRFRLATRRAPHR